MVRLFLSDLISYILFFNQAMPPTRHTCSCLKGLCYAGCPFCPRYASPPSRHLLVVPFPDIFPVSCSLISLGSLLKCYPFKESFSTVLLHHHSLSLTWFNFFLHRIYHYLGLYLLVYLFSISCESFTKLCLIYGCIPHTLAHHHHNHHNC